MNSNKCPFCGADSVCYDSRIIRYECLTTNCRISHLDTQSETCKQVCQLQKEHQQLEERHKRLVEAGKSVVESSIVSGKTMTVVKRKHLEELRKAVEG